MTKEDLPEPRSPLPKLQTFHGKEIMEPTTIKDLYQETVLLRQDLNKVLTYLKLQES